MIAGEATPWLQLDRGDMEAVPWSGTSRWKWEEAVGLLQGGYCTGHRCELCAWTVGFGLSHSRALWI